MLQIFIFIAQRTRAGRSSLRTQGVCYNINLKQCNTLHVSKNRRQTQTDALRMTLLRLCLCDVFNRAEKQSVYYSDTICVTLFTENRHRRRLLQAWQRSPEGERSSPGPD